MHRSQRLTRIALALLLAALLGPAAARAWSSWEESRRTTWIREAIAALERGEETLPPVPWGVDLIEPEGNGIERDDPNIRRLLNLIQFGTRTPEYQAYLLRVAAEENRKARALAARPGTDRIARGAAGRPDAPISPTPPTSLTWDNLGPASARSEFNGTYYQAIDSGRPTAIRVDPTDSNTLYLAVSGGGVWKTTNFHTATPGWTPLTDMLGSLAIGAMDVDPSNHLTLYIGTGDAFDQKGGSVLRSDDGGLSWGPPVLLTGTHPIAGGLTVTASSIRSLAVDPTTPNTVIAATDVGLFRSIDGGVSWSVIDLPNAGAYNAPGLGNVDLESTWDIAYLGNVGGVSQWVVSGAWACPGFFPPGAGGGTAPCPNSGPTGGNVGDVWKSVDAGVTWTSARAQGTLPTQAPGWPTTLGDVGRIALGSAPAADPSTATIYAEAGNATEGSSRTILLFKSVDGGASWAAVGTPLTTNLTNRTIASGSACPTLDLGHAQSWYNLTVAVDPGNPSRALMGGDLCGVRTIDGGATWQLVAHWLPSSGLSDTSDGAGPLPYVHADWHALTISRVGGRFVALAGTDGGIFRSYDVFDVTPTNTASWAFPDIGLITHLTYGHGSGDPVLGNAQVLYAGFQDNGTRWRLSQTENVAIVSLKNFDQISGGDGTGATVGTDANGQNPVYWGSVQNRRKVCRPANRDCGVATRIVDGTEVANWVNTTAPAVAGDGEPFVERFSPTFDAVSSVLSATVQNVYRITVDANDVVTFTRLTPAGIFSGTTRRNIQNQQIHASPWTYPVGGVPARVYGVVLTGGNFATLTDTGAGTPALAVTALGMQLGGETVTGSSSIAFPRDPASLGGTDIRSTFVAATLATVSTVAGVSQPVSAALGHLLKTIDGGNTWVPMHGNGTGFDLPNIPIYVVRYDPGDPTDQTLYVGTELGLYRTTDGGSTWVRYGALPLVRITDITVARNGSLLRVSTYGRGLWEIYPHSEASPAPGNGDWDQNGVVDFLDLMALASRLGTSPPAPGAVPPIPPVPRYESSLDLAASPTTLDEADLGALVAKFGSTP